NVVQYAALVHMFAQVSGLVPGELVHVIADAHIYDRHIPLVEELLKCETYDAPEFVMNKEKTSFYDFTVDDFRLENYRYSEFNLKIPVAI
ncbi:MAG: thymidylate synthase, partial [Oscillospiraceae bacterium]|nr:thymidylate synthase [Oscillospiraceae bacterium]